MSSVHPEPLAQGLQPLPPAPLHLPFEAQSFRMAMGLVGCAEPDWLELDAHYGAELAERRGLLDARRPEVFGALPGSGPARQETLALVASHLVRHHAAWFTQDGTRLFNRLTGEWLDLAAPRLDPLEEAGRLVQEDLLLLQSSPEGPVLEAALLCAPSRWRLHEKLGLPLQAVHGPVPFYAERLGAAVDRFLGQLRGGRIAVRFNWSVVDDGSLFQPFVRPRGSDRPAVTASNAGEVLYLRCERQSFRLLDASGRVLFAIRVHSHTLARIAAVPGAAMRLAAAIRALPEAMLAYKSMERDRDAMLAFLDAVPSPG